MGPGQLKKGQAYYRLTFADAAFTIPGIEPMMYIGCNIFPEDRDDDPIYHFQDTVSFHQHGSCLDYSGPPLPEEETFCTHSFKGREIGTSIVDLPEAIRQLLEANQRAELRK